MFNGPMMAKIELFLRRKTILAMYSIYPVCLTVRSEDKFGFAQKNEYGYKHVLYTQYVERSHGNNIFVFV